MVLFFSFFVEMSACFVHLNQNAVKCSERDLQCCPRSLPATACGRIKHVSLSDHRARALKTPHTEAKCKLYLSVLHILWSEFSLCFSFSAVFSCAVS